MNYRTRKFVKEKLMLHQQQKIDTDARDNAHAKQKRFYCSGLAIKNPPDDDSAAALSAVASCWWWWGWSLCGALSKLRIPATVFETSAKRRDRSIWRSATCAIVARGGGGILVLLPTNCC